MSTRQEYVAWNKPKKSVKTDWRLENIWVSTEDTAAVDVYILWTDYSTVSFLGDQDRGLGTLSRKEKETLLWCFHVKQDGYDKNRGKDKPERRLFNVANDPQQVFGTWSAQVETEIEERLAGALTNQVVKSKALEAPEGDLSSLLGNIVDYISERLDGEHWAINVKDDQKTAICKKIDAPDSRGGVEVSKGKGNTLYVQIGQTSFNIAKTGSKGNQLQITNYSSNLGEKPNKDIEKQNKNYDIDKEYWIKEFDGATNTKYFYLVVNGLMESDKKVKRFRNRKGKLARKTVTIGGDWDDPLLNWKQFCTGSFLKNYGIKNPTVSDQGYFDPDTHCVRVTKDYLEKQRFLDWMDEVGSDWLESGGVVERDIWEDYKMHFEQWALLVMNSNEMSERQFFGIVNGAAQKQKERLRKETEYYNMMYDLHFGHHDSSDDGSSDYLTDPSLYERKYSLKIKLLT